MDTNVSALVPRHVNGWRMGLANMLAKENFAWWHTRRWWIQILVAVLFLNGSLALNLRDPLGALVDLQAINYLNTSALFVPILIVILAQEAILNERHSGTTAWVLSKPLKRPAFILSKLIAYGLGFLVTWVLIPNIIFYIQLVAAGRVGLSIPGFIGLIALSYLNLLFYLTLALMLATLFDSRVPGLGISLLGAKLPTVLPIIATLLWCVLFVGVAIWRISREEF
jgi:ABC-type transport system involved in multi-copper enzyme maturation permease subunit